MVAVPITPFRQTPFLAEMPRQPSEPNITRQPQTSPQASCRTSALLCEVLRQSRRNGTHDRENWVPPTASFDHRPFSRFQGNGYCEDFNNREECAWDGGDVSQAVCFWFWKFHGWLLLMTLLPPRHSPPAVVHMLLLLLKITLGVCRRMLNGCVVFLLRISPAGDTLVYPRPTSPLPCSKYTV